MDASFCPYPLVLQCRKLILVDVSLAERKRRYNPKLIGVATVIQVRVMLMLEPPLARVAALWSEFACLRMELDLADSFESACTSPAQVSTTRLLLPGHLGLGQRRFREHRRFLRLRRCIPSCHVLGSVCTAFVVCPWPY